MNAQLTAQDIQSAIIFRIKREDALSAKEIADYYPGLSAARVTTQIKKMVAAGQIQPLGTSNSGARCYGLAGN